MNQPQEAGMSEVIEIMARAMCNSLMPSIICSDSCRCVEHSNAVRAALSALSASGYVVVPKEPTEAMIEAGAKAAWELGGAEYSGHAIFGPWEQLDDLRQKRGKRTFKFGYPAMLAAAGGRDE